MSCVDCKYRVKDYSTGTEDCMMYDEMTEEETQTYWVDGGGGCPYYEEDNYDMFAEDEGLWTFYESEEN